MDSQGKPSAALMVSFAVMTGRMHQRVELYAAIRHAHRTQQLSKRELARQFKVGRDTVTQALESPTPKPRKTPERDAPRLGPFKDAIEEMLVYDLTAPLKQRHTATRIHTRLTSEHGASLSYSSVRNYVKTRRRELAAENGRSVGEVFIPQLHRPGTEAEVDFGQFDAIIGGEQRTCYMFAMRLCHSGKAVHRVYPTLAQEAFLDGHVEAFTVLGGVPTVQVKYDNLTPAVVKVLTSRDRQENSRWTTFTSHYGFDPFYCLPGKDGAHEKGGVEGQIGWFRRNHLTPMPQVASIAELNELCALYDYKDNDRKITGRSTTIGAAFAIEKPLLAPLPQEHFDPSIIMQVRVNKSSLVPVRQVYYSVPCRYVGHKVRVALGALTVRVYDKGTLIACHPRSITRWSSVVELDHYLDVLMRKPGAMAGSVALSQAKDAGVFTKEHEVFWEAARLEHGDSAGTKALIDVLLLHRHLPAEHVKAGITAALSVGSTSVDVVTLEARRYAEHTTNRTTARPTPPAPATQELSTAPVLHRAKVTSLLPRRLGNPAAIIAALPPDTRPGPPDISKYDALLTHTTPTTDHSVTAPAAGPLTTSADPQGRVNAPEPRGTGEATYASDRTTLNPMDTVRGDTFAPHDSLQHTAQDYSFKESTAS